MDIYMAFDTETGGLNAENHSLLTAYFAFCVQKDDGTYQIIDELDLSLLDPYGEYRVTQEALSINKINLTELKKNGISCRDAAKLLFDKIKHHTIDGRKKITLIGQNISFDEKFINTYLIPKSVWANYMYLDPKFKLDTKVILKQKQKQGKIPKDQSLSLGPAAKFLGIEVDTNNLHGAKYDTLMCIKVLEKAVKL
jgi:DNA polymerase III epsilon subunit-like protein